MKIDWATIGILAFVVFVFGALVLSFAWEIGKVIAVFKWTTVHLSAAGRNGLREHDYSCTYSLNALC